jgi:plasmid stabilization system protein ParE
MVYDLIIRPEAEKDLSEIFLWYEDKRVGLGFDFLLQVDAGLRYISKNPMTNEIIYKSVRIHLTKRFPYKIIYLVKGKKIVVLGVLHASRNTKVLKGRTKNS